MQLAFDDLLSLVEEEREAICTSPPAVGLKEGGPPSRGPPNCSPGAWPEPSRNWGGAPPGSVHGRRQSLVVMGPRRHFS